MLIFNLYVSLVVYNMYAVYIFHTLFYMFKSS